MNAIEIVIDIWRERYHETVRAFEHNEISRELFRTKLLNLGYDYIQIRTELEFLESTRTDTYAN